MSMATSIPAEVIDRIVSLRESGMRLMDVAEATGISSKVCGYHALKWGGIPDDYPPPKAPAAPYKRGSVTVRAFTPSEDRRIREWAIQKVPYIEIGRRLNRRHNSIINRLRVLAARDAVAEKNL